MYCVYVWDKVKEREFKHYWVSTMAEAREKEKEYQTKYNQKKYAVEIKTDRMGEISARSYF